MSVQFIYDDDNKPVYAIIPIDEYTKLKDGVRVEEFAVAKSLLSDDGLYIKLRHPGVRLDLRQFVDAWMRAYASLGIATIPIGTKQQAYSEFTAEHRNALDPILRRCFLPVHSPYVNTVQTTKAVIEAFLQTGMFTRTIESRAEYYRPVQCLRIDMEKALKFLEVNGRPEHPVWLDQFLL